MPAGVTPASNRTWTINANDNGNILEIGIAQPTNHAGMWSVQFHPDPLFNGQVVVMGRAGGAQGGPATVPGSSPFMPYPYRRVVVNNVASDRTIVSDPISTPTIIEIPSGMCSIGFLVVCTTGTMTYWANDLTGPSIQ